MRGRLSPPLPLSLHLNLSQTSLEEVHCIVGSTWLGGHFEYILCDRKSFFERNFDLKMSKRRLDVSGNGAAVMSTAKRIKEELR